MVGVEQQVERAPAPVGGATVRFVDPLDDPAWDRKIAQFERATSFHSTAWCRVLKDAYALRPLYAVAEKKGVLIGVLPVMEADNLPRGRRGVSLPFTDECCALSGDAEVIEQMAGAVMENGKRRGWSYAEFRGTRVTNATPALSFYTHRLELGPNDKILRRFDSSVQRAIRKAERAGVTVEMSNTIEAVRAFYELHERTRRKHGAPPQPFTFFANIQRYVLEAGQGFVALARLADRVIAGAMFFHFGNRAIYKFGASDDRFQHLRPNNLTFWKAIRALADSGIGELDFGRTSVDNEGLRRFKLGWGSAESGIDYFKFDFRSNRFTKDCDRASGWHTHIFNVLPGPICRWTGAMIYGRLA